MMSCEVLSNTYRMLTPLVAMRDACRQTLMRNIAQECRPVSRPYGLTIMKLEDVWKVCWDLRVTSRNLVERKDVYGPKRISISRLPSLLSLSLSLSLSL